MRHPLYKSGFTFIEVLIAMLIFVMIALAASDMVRGSVRATKDAKEVSKANWLLQNILTEMETKIEAEGFEKGCEKKKEARFDKPNEEYTWLAYCNEIDLQFSEATQALEKEQEEGNGEDNKKEDAIKKMIEKVASDYMGKSLRELHVEIAWNQGKTKRKIAATTHLVRYDQTVALPSLNLGGN